jgi:hypothetical protein
MNTIKGFAGGATSQLRYLWKILALLYIPVALLFVLVGLLSRTVDNASLAFFLRDIVATGKLPFFAGFVAQLAGLLWAASLAVCLFAASLAVCLFSLYVLSRQKGNFASAKRLLLLGGVLTAALLLDDIFLFHEEIAPFYLHINEKLVVASYGILGIIFVYANWREILRSEYLILMLALGLFAISILLDALPIDDFHLRYFWEQLEMFMEDGTKFAGIATWLTYFVRYAQQQITTAHPGSTTSSM